MDTWQNGWFGKIDDHPAHTAPTTTIQKWMAFQKIHFFKSSLPLELLCGIQFVCPTNQQRRPLPFLLWDSYIMLGGPPAQIFLFLSCKSTLTMTCQNCLPVSRIFFGNFLRHPAHNNWRTCRLILYYLSSDDDEEELAQLDDVVPDSVRKWLASTFASQEQVDGSPHL